VFAPFRIEPVGVEENADVAPRWLSSFAWRNQGVSSSITLFKSWFFSAANRVKPCPSLVEDAANLRITVRDEARERSHKTG
jgi:hypothetical protein